MRLEPKKIFQSYGTMTLMLLFASSIINCKDNIVTSSWRQQPIEIDGKINDWEGISVNYFKDQNAIVSLCNDSSYLYLQFRTKNVKWVKLIKMSGLTLYFDSKGKKNKDFYLKFTGGPSNKDLQALIGNGNDQVFENMPMQMTDQMNSMMQDKEPEFLCVDKKLFFNKLLPLDGSNGPEVSFGEEFGSFIYEFKVPLQKSTTGNYGINAESGTVISIGVSWGEMKKFRDMMKKQMGNSPPGRGMRGGPPGGGMRGRKLPKKQEVWLKTKLALSSKPSSLTTSND